MKIYFTLDGTKISSYSEFPMDLAENEIQYEIETDLDFDKLRFCDYINEELVYNKLYENEIELLRLRNKRERVCFRVINRGQPWYNTLTTEQLVEIQSWYQAWLDAPQTLVEPEKPIWLTE